MNMTYTIDTVEDLVRILDEHSFHRADVIVEAAAATRS